MNLYSRAAHIALEHVKKWLPGGRNGGSMYTLDDIFVSLDTGMWTWADESGRDLVSLYALKNIMSKPETAAREILEKYDPDYFPSDDDEFVPVVNEEDPFEKLRVIQDQRQARVIEYETYSTQKPTALLEDVSPTLMERVQDELWFTRRNKQNEEERVLRSDWQFRIIDIDPDIRGCQKIDYTIGTYAMYYRNNKLLESALVRRLIALGIPANSITPQKRSDLLDRVALINQGYNAITEHLDILKKKHVATEDTVLDEFLKMIEWDYEKIRSDQSVPDFEADKERMDRVYRELFDKFFLRMHIHINGTRLREDGEYVGLIENDIVPILEGGQDIGKTSICRWLAMDDYFYTDLGSGGKGGFGSADTIRKVRGKLIAELGEMKITKREDDIEQIKSFISSKQFDLDIKYVEFSKPLPVTVSYLGTSNPPEYLTDDTGNRRYYPVYIKSIDKDALYRNKILAEKLHAHYNRKASEVNDKFKALAWSKELNDFMNSRRADAMIKYSDYEIIFKLMKDWLKNNPNKVVQNHEVEKIVFDAGYTFIRSSRKSIRMAMEKLGFVYRQNKIGGDNVRGWKFGEDIKNLQPELKPEDDDVPF